MRVAFLAEAFLLDVSTGLNGTQVQLYNLAEGFVKRGVEVDYIASTKNFRKDNEVINGIRVHWARTKEGPFSWVRNIFIYLNKLDQIQPDVVYQRGRSYLTYVGMKWAKKNQKKFIWGSNGEDGCDFWKHMRLLWSSKKPLWKKLILSPGGLVQDMFIHKGIRGSDNIVNQTENQKQRLFKNFHKMGLVVPSYFPVPFQASEPVHKEKMVLWLANLSPKKQPELFIQLAEYCRSCSGWRFVLGGGTKDKEYLHRISALSRTLPNMEMVGPVPFEESNGYFSRASLFVNTSMMEAEGLPNAFIQAWLAGAPVLSLVHDPNGWIMKNHLGICAKGNLREFLEKGKALLMNRAEREAMGERCRDFAMTTFATDRIIDEYIRIFEEGSAH